MKPHGLIQINATQLVSICLQKQRNYPIRSFPTMSLQRQENVKSLPTMTSIREISALQKHAVLAQVG